MVYAIEELEKKERLYRNDHILKDLSVECRKASESLKDGVYSEVSDEVIFLIEDTLKCVRKSLDEGTKELSDWRKRQLKRERQLNDAIMFLRPNMLLLKQC